MTVVDCPLIPDTDFGNVYLDITTDEFNALGFDFGDCVDVVFSNGYELQDIPYFNGYYVNVGDPLVIAYPGYPHVAVALNYGALWDEAELSEGDTATVTLDTGTVCASAAKTGAVVTAEEHSVIGGLGSGVDENAEDVGLRSLDYSGPARRYLIGGGMTEEQIDTLVARLVG